MKSGKSARYEKLISAAESGRKRLRCSHCAGISGYETPMAAQDRLNLLALRREKMPQHFAYAYVSTGVIVTEENEDYLDPQDVSRWYAAALEYFEAERCAKTAIAPVGGLSAVASMAYERAIADGRWL